MSTPPNAVRILHVEDTEDDADLIHAMLLAAGVDMAYTRVDSADALRAALDGNAWDIVLTDFNLPALDAFGVLAMVAERPIDLPVIVVSGHVGEESAVALMHAGARDFVMKGNLARLAPAIERELAQAASRAQKRAAEAQLVESRRQLQELTAFLQDGIEEERKHIARELHDELGQCLTALRIDLIWMGDKLVDPTQAVATKLDAMKKLVDHTVDSVRRISGNLRPGILDDLGLAAAIEDLAAKFRAQTGVACQLSLDRDSYDLNDRACTTLYRVVQESLTNIARHARARQASIALVQEADALRLSVRDDGLGFDLAVQSALRKSYGLLGMRERLRLLGGQLDIHSTPGLGTSLAVTIPLTSASAP